MLFELLIVSLAVNAFFFAFAVTMKTDKVTDLSYSLSFIMIAGYALARLTVPVTVWHLVIALFIVVWAMRLGGYLVLRIMRTRVDHRFDAMRDRPLAFARFWLLQAVTVWIVMLPFMLALPTMRAGMPWCLAGGIVWLVGLYLEARSDMEKFRFRNIEANKGRPVDAGLWRYSRHPNYFGEMLVWWGIWLAVLPAWGASPALLLVAAIGPLFLSLMLLFVSGIPLLEKQATERYGKKWNEYARKTSMLVPWPPKR